MKLRNLALLLLGLAVALPLTMRADGDRERKGRHHRDRREDSDHYEHNRKTPVNLIGAITVPGNPITSTDISWVDPGTERYYVADRSNNGVDIIDTEDEVAFSYVGRVTGMAGALPSGGGTTTTNGPGPNGVLVTPDRHLWAGDGNSTVQVADVDPTSVSYLTILKSISTNIPDCDAGPGPSGHYCGRADELGYDPSHHKILVANNAPRSTSAGHAAIAPYATFIDATTYAVLGHISFAGAGGLEQPIWDRTLQKFWLTVPGPTGGHPSIVRIDPITMMVDKTFTLDCMALAGVVSASITGIALAPSEHMLVAACGFPIALNALSSSGNPTLVTKQVGGGDEIWYNSGDGRLYVTGLDTSTPPVQSLGVIDAEKGVWLQNVPAVRGRNASAFAENNRIFAAVQVTAAIVANPATDDSVCATKFGIKGRGCIGVFTHSGTEEEDTK